MQQCLPRHACQARQARFCLGWSALLGAQLIQQGLRVTDELARWINHATMSQISWPQLASHDDPELLHLADCFHSPHATTVRCPDPLRVQRN